MLSAERSPTYRPAEIEPRWQARWEADCLHEVDLDGADADPADPAEPGDPPRKLYNLVEFPYPSAEG